MAGGEPEREAEGPRGLREAEGRQREAEGRQREAEGRPLEARGPKEV